MQDQQTGNVTNRTPFSHSAQNVQTGLSPDDMATHPARHITRSLHSMSLVPMAQQKRAARYQRLRTSRRQGAAPITEPLHRTDILPGGTARQYTRQYTDSSRFTAIHVPPPMTKRLRAKPEGQAHPRVMSLPYQGVVPVETRAAASQAVPSVIASASMRDVQNRSFYYLLALLTLSTIGILICGYLFHITN
ncbi:hypothetical protein EI42_00673 [Thermosporothrix hazakensis]|uniref:Uncharacterized protein n=1 Tax=Thermosporothrix hazakensis TaxID=644383 RepID=A0A326UDH4_THEHA|nr:hypothetical protein [Thermosporothrix hazakensis]PZW36497.1 hypothetical protein EI42_00673 [Thermosporothrix hazakensis]